MKSNPKLAAVAALALLLLAQPAAFAQKQKQADDKRPPAQKIETKERLEPDDATAARPGVPEQSIVNRREGMSEEADGAIPSYNNFFTTYLLGPEDVISISVFGLDKYSVPNITVPPDGRIDYFFSPEGIHVVGKTTRQVREEIAQLLDEYIIDPKVKVTLDKAVSQRYGVVGDVAQPGIRLLNRRVSVYEALTEAGGILPTGKKQVVVLHWNVDRIMERKVVDIAKIEKGIEADSYFLRPGDQIFVPGNKYKTVKEILGLLPVVNFMRVFTGGF
ncbi:MAG TPA: polysaccharide biosynthesis/export family protein [Pyrinomonadaceae bacterium]|nr:polysaccharide biosynthesis/export family protein [Pyrinomonadaceae bacterium]